MNSKGVGSAESSSAPTPGSCGSRKLAAVCGSVDLGFLGRILRLSRDKDAASHGFLAVNVSSEEHDARRANIFWMDYKRSVTGIQTFCFKVRKLIADVAGNAQK